MKRAMNVWRCGLCLLSGAVLMFSAAPLSAAPNPNPQVVPPQSTPLGHTYSEWSARWWQWALSVPASRNPLLDTTGEFCSQGQSAGVWFLAGTLGPSVTRSCSVPAGRMLFFPLLNNVWLGTPDDEGGPPETQTQVENGFTGIVLPQWQSWQGATVTATIDGKLIQGLAVGDCTTPTGQQASPYCVVSRSFQFTIPSDSILAPTSAGQYWAKGIGLYLMLAPLSDGKHTVHFSVTGPFAQDVTYDLTIGPQ